MKAPPIDRLIRQSEAAGILDVSRQMVRKLVAAGRLDSWEIGGLPMLDRQQVESRRDNPPLPHRPRRKK